MELPHLKRMTTTAGTVQPVNDFPSVSVFPGVDQSEVHERTAKIMRPDYSSP
jgi:hypothetical protein